MYGYDAEDHFSIDSEMICVLCNLSGQASILNGPILKRLDADVDSAPAIKVGRYAISLRPTIYYSQQRSQVANGLRKYVNLSLGHLSEIIAEGCPREVS